MSSSQLEGVRNTRDWYLGKDPLALVDAGLLDYVHTNAGRRVLDLGCGTGGYSRRLMSLGHEVVACDVNPTYVKIARGLGVDAFVYDGNELPLPENHVDSIFCLEVLEHVSGPERVLREAARVTRGNVIVSVPNCSQGFGPAPVTWTHMLDVDHRNFFSRATLKELLEREFSDVTVVQISPANVSVAYSVLPWKLARAYEFLVRLGVMKETHYFRLLGIAKKGEMAA